MVHLNQEVVWVVFLSVGVNHYDGRESEVQSLAMSVGSVPWWWPPPKEEPLRRDEAKDNYSARTG